MQHPFMTNWKTTLYKTVLPDLEEYLKQKQSTEPTGDSGKGILIVAYSELIAKKKVREWPHRNLSTW